MQIFLNGQSKQLPSTLTVADLLHDLNLYGKRFAVERNGEIVPKGLHATTQLVENDRLEIVIAVGGG